MAPENSYYDLLGIARDATLEEIRRAYREAVRRLHPDANPKSAQNPELFLRVQTAYETLTDSQKRSEYDLSLPPVPEVLHLQVLYSRSSLPAMTEAQLVFVLMELSAPANTENLPAPPLNISLVLDRSTSMQGARMDMVKTTAIELMRNLRPQDVLSLIIFSDKAEVILPAGSRMDTREIETRIQMLQTFGGTEIFNGLNAGYNEVARHANPRYVNHIILITDGKTYGDEQRCLELAQKARAQGISISALGIGGEWNDVFLDQLANLTGGHTAYIAKPADIKGFLEDKFLRLGKTYADNIRFSFSSDPGITLNYAFRLQPEVDPLHIAEDGLLLGSLQREEPLTIIMEFQAKDVRFSSLPVNLAHGRIYLEVPGSKNSALSKQLTLTIKTSGRSTHEPPPPEIVNALSKLTLYRMQEKAQKEVDGGQIEDAAKRLRVLATNLLSQGESALARVVVEEADNLIRTKLISPEGGKAIKYGTRSLLLPQTGEKRKSL